MEVKTLDGGTINVRLSNKVRKNHSVSKFQNSIGQELQTEYPHDTIYEEVHIPGENFKLDFFIPSINLVVECHGRQHTEHVKHFHKTIRDYNKQRDTDRRKREWCDLNGFKLLEIYDE